MKKIWVVILVVISLLFSLTACSGSKEAVSQKTEEEIRAEIKKELEEEMQNQDVEENVQIEPKVLSREELESKKDEYESQLYDFLDGFEGGFYTNDITQFEYYNSNIKFRDYVDMLLSLGYGIEQAEGYYYLYVGEPVGYKEEGVTQTSNKEPNQTSPNQEYSADVLMESDGNNYYKYKANQTVKFDIDEDGVDESINYDTKNGKLKIEGYDAIDIDTMFAETNYFIIIKFNDKFDNKLNMIGIIDYGPSNDLATNLYSIIVPMDEKWFGHVGVVGGEIVPPSKYDETSIEDFNYKAVLYDGQGIEAPVRLSILSDLQTWYGRNDFTYYPTYKSLLDNINIYEQDYKTILELRIEKDVIAYKEKNMNSESFTIVSGQMAYFLATDNNEWIGIVAEDGSEGWINVKDVSDVNFLGFILFD